MASTVLSFKPSVSIRTHASSPPKSSSKSGSASWWSPIFGWSAQPDYLVSGGGSAGADPSPAEQRRFGVFTEEKARELRKKMMETESYHDAMYHSAIASRLASDFSRKN